MAESLSTLPHIVFSFFLVSLLLLLLPSSSTYDHNNVLVTSMAEAHIQDHAAPAAAAETMEWAGSDGGAASIYSSYPFGYEEDDEEVGGGGGEEDEDEMMGAMDSRKDTRRALFWHRIRYYISYAALSANRIPCPPRSGRSYYTHNCYRARGPVHPYSRSCSIITRCRS